MSNLQDPLYRNSQVSPVRVASTSNQTGVYFNGNSNNGVGATFTYTSTGALTIDSVALVANDYVLLADQTLGYENGIYQVLNPGAVGVAAVLQRRSDFQNIEQIKTGFYVPVYAGTVNGGSMFQLIEPAPLAIGVPSVSGNNNLIFSDTSGSGGGPFLVASNNLSDVVSAPTSVTNLGFTQTAAAISSSVTQLGSLNQISVILTPAEVIAAYATPQVLIPAVAGKVAIVHSATVYTASTGNTAFATGVGPIIQYGTTAHGAGTIAVGTGLVTGDITAATSQVRTIGSAASAVYTGVTDEAICFSCTTAYTAGTGTDVTFTLVYELITATV